MNYHSKITIALTILTLTTTNVLTSGQGRNFQLEILHNNDMLARFDEFSKSYDTCYLEDKLSNTCYGGFARIAYVIKKFRERAKLGHGPPVLYLNAGSTFTGTEWFTLYKWKIAADFMNALQPDAISLGTREFDIGVSGLIQFLKRLTCPVLASNLNLIKERELAEVRQLAKSVILNIQGNSVGIIGYLTPRTSNLALKNYVRYIDEIEAIQKEATKLNNLGVKIIIALGHSGYATDQQIAREVEHIDLVVGGHSETFLWSGEPPDTDVPEGPYPTFVTQPSSGRIVGVVQSFAYGKYLGSLRLTFNSDGDVIGFNGKPILLDHTVPQDGAVLDLTESYRSNIKNVTGIVIGRTAINLDGSVCGLEECNMGNLITDAMISKYVKQYDGHGWTDAPIAIIQAGAIWASVTHRKLPTNITLSKILKILPFETPLAKVTVDGTKILKMLEHSVAYYDKEKPSDYFLQMSGLQVVYDLNKSPGTRVVSVGVLCGLCNMPKYLPLNQNSVYKIIMSKFLYLGGDDYSMFSDASKFPLNFDQVEALTEYIRIYSPLYVGTEGRIVFLNPLVVSNSTSLPPKMLQHSIS